MDNMPAESWLTGSDDNTVVPKLIPGFSGGLALT